MCGISGYFSVNNAISGKEFYAAHLTMSRRGPNDEGFFFVSPRGETSNAYGNDTDSRVIAGNHIEDIERLKIILGHRRLSIVDLSVSGHQPYLFRNKVLVFNGEIFNYLELKAELSAEGYEFKTSTDTEVFLVAYEAWGQAAFSRFNGMWAAAIYDKESKDVVLTRDRFGIKPLYYTIKNGNLYFASELKFFKEFALLNMVNEEVVFQYLRYSETDFDEHTFFSGIYQLTPGTTLCFNGAQLSSYTYWDLASKSISVDSSTELIDLLRSAVELRLRADVPVGSLLSGGIDSSLIVGLVNEIKGLGSFRSYSAVFSDERFSEKRFIEENCRYLNFEPTYLYLTSDDLVKNIDQLIYVQEMPFRSLSVLSQFMIYKSIANEGRVKVLLNGQGADEIFAGYTEHYSYYFLTLLKRFRWVKLVKEFIQFGRIRRIGVVKNLLFVVKTAVSSFYSNYNKNNLFNKKFQRRRDSRKYLVSPLKKRLYRNLSY